MTSPAGHLRPTRPEPRPLPDVLVAVAGLLAPVQDAVTRAAVQVTGVVSDNRVVQPGDLLVALPGAHVHGARFVADAAERGAVAVVTDAEGAALLAAERAPARGSGSVDDVPVIVVSDARAALGPLAAAVHGHPARAFASFGVTGTNGKTTTTYALDALLTALGRTTGLVGTVEIRSAGRVVPSVLTTPEAADLQAVFAAMRQDGVDALAMEVSSHALALHRVDGVVYDVAGFTNLSQDHLDFHGTLDDYFAVKAQLFTPARSRRGVVVVPAAGPGRERALRLLRESGVPAVGVRVDGPEAGAEPGWVVRDVAPADQGQTFVLAHDDGRAFDVATSLPGAFNVANVALAAAMVAESGVAEPALRAALAAGVRPLVPGRMEQVGDRPRTIVDFAHNPDALALALDALRPTTGGRLVVVFGATGERDVGKRPVMGAVAVDGADVVVVTDDDPHGEDAASVRRAVLDGARVAQERARAGGRHVELVEVAPRADAIRRAVLEAGDDDTVLVAGRGHEVWQEIDGVNHPLDDRVEARAALALRDDARRKQDA